MANIFYGIRRLILLNTVSYSLGDFPLDRPLSISAPNNRGKSTAINALQFPFLSNMTDMAFPRSNEETRRYYFPYDNSYVISEIVTETGSFVVGAVGKGQASGYEYRLFAYKAKLNLDVFLIAQTEGSNTDKQSRTFKELSTHLGRQDVWVKLLSPKQMRDALMGKTITLSHDEKFTIGVFRLVSMTDDNYRLFIRVFKNLLHMNNVNLEEMKHLLIDVLMPGQGGTSIDFMARYRILNEEVDQANARLNVATTILDDVEKLAEAAAARDDSYGILRALFPRITSSYAAEMENRKKEIKKLQDRIHAIEPEIKKLSASQEPLQGKMQTVAIEENQLKSEIETIQTGESTYALYPPQATLEKQLADLNDEMERLVGELQRTQPENVKGLKTELREVNNRLKEMEARIAAINNNLLFLLSEHFTEMEIQTFAKLLNRDLLSLLPLNDNGVSVLNEEALLDWVRSTLELCKEGIYADSRVRIRLDDIPAIDINDYFNHERIEEQRTHLQNRQKQLVRDIEVALDYEELKNKKNILAEKITTEKRELDKYIDYLSKKPNKPALQKERNRLETIGKRSKPIGNLLGSIGNRAEWIGN